MLLLKCKHEENMYRTCTGLLYCLAVMLRAVQCVVSKPHKSCCQNLQNEGVFMNDLIGEVFM